MVSGVQRVRLFIERILEGLTLMGFIAVLVMMLWGTIDVIMQGFGSSLPATVPWTEVLNVVAVMLPLAYTTSKKSHIVIDLVTKHIPGRAKRLVDLVVMIMMFLFMLILSWQLSIQAWRSVKMWEFDQLSIKIYYFPAKIALAVAFIMSAFVVLFQMIDQCRGQTRR